MLQLKNAIKFFYLTNNLSIQPRYQIVKKYLIKDQL